MAEHNQLKLLMFFFFRSSDTPFLPRAAARLREAGIITFSVGVAGADRKELGVSQCCLKKIDAFDIKFQFLVFFCICYLNLSVNKKFYSVIIDSFKPSYLIK